MPLLLQGALAWVAGTALGLSVRDARPWLVALLLCAALGWLARRSRRARNAEYGMALALLVGAGLLLGADLAAADRRCAALARAGDLRELTLGAAAAPGSFVRAELHAPGCVVPLAVAVRSGAAAAGARVRWEGGELSEGDRGLLLRDARLRSVAGPGPLARWRNTVAARLDARFAADGPMVRALLIADTRGLDPGLRERYADAGLVHMLSISGLHVAIVGGSLLLLAGVLRLPPRVAAVAAVATTGLYVLAIGAPPPALRSVTLFAATQAARLAQRPISPWGAYALGALVPLVEPRTVLDLGWQLSVSGYAAIIVAGRVGRRMPEDWPRWGRALGRELTTGALSTLATAPLVAWHFGRLSLVAPLSNLFAGPIVSLLQPALFVVMLLPDVPGLGIVMDASVALMRALDAVAAAAAALPLAAVQVAPSQLAIVLALLGTAAVLVAGWSRAPARPALVAILATAALAWLPADRGIGAASGELELHVLDVGQGDALALRSPRGRWLLVDAGRVWASGDAGRSVVLPYLRRRGGVVTDLVLTHPHADHIGGATSILRALHPARVHDSGFVEPSEHYAEVLREAAAAGAEWRRLRPGQRFDFDGATVEVLAPDSAWVTTLRDPNAASAVLAVTYGTHRLLLTGDAEADEERWLLEHRPAALAATVLKVGHHGSRTSTGADFLAAVGPRLAIVSVGAGNFYGHPSPEVMRRLTLAGAQVLRTDQLGPIVLRSDGTKLEVEAAGIRWPVAPRLPEHP
ncbi:MAG: DNA internalization-related competence protein ComEC/Rec2 [Gemmatimonadaceae bacterium]|nr:DNA internalization-related competence protein ComEC/Rec2 [Gemmatimonadaceae bacterium]